MMDHTRRLDQVARRLVCLCLGTDGPGNWYFAKTIRRWIYPDNGTRAPANVPDNQCSAGDVILWGLPLPPHAGRACV
jgi:hypothetical protein